MTLITKRLQKLLKYVKKDEENHFWENCECPGNVAERQLYFKCKCQANKNHIYRDIVALQIYLDNLMDKPVIPKAVIKKHKPSTFHVESRDEMRL